MLSFVFTQSEFFIELVLRDLVHVYPGSCLNTPIGHRMWNLITVSLISYRNTTRMSKTCFIDPTYIVLWLQSCSFDVNLCKFQQGQEQGQVWWLIAQCEKEARNNIRN